MKPPSIWRLLALCGALGITAQAHAADPSTTGPMDITPPHDVVRTVDKPYNKPSLPAPTPVSASTPVPSLASAPPSEAVRYELTLADADVRRAFERWARGYKTLIWLLQPDLPVDAATGPITPLPGDLSNAQQAQSGNPELLATMMQVAHSFEHSKTPFVIREYDNAIVVRPRAGSRP